MVRVATWRLGLNPGRCGTIPCTSRRCFSRNHIARDTEPPSTSDKAPITKYSPGIPKALPEKIIFSGIQPTGVPHLGNYLGALRQWKQLQDDQANAKNRFHHRLYFSIVDLHALTHSQNPTKLLQNKRETLASLLAIGLDSKKSSIFYQSSIRAHAQLMWYLSNVASTGYLSRMTQWKSKLGVPDTATLDDSTAKENLRLGLFSYPVLQAADILLYNATLVPVGEDQAQHVEFTRTLARSFNSKYKFANHGQDIFRIPEALISPAKRIMSLKNPATKMSKSDPDVKSRILITDSPENIHAKFKAALTDSIEGISYDPNLRPGVSNLIEILKHVGGSDASCEEIASDNSNTSMRAFKDHVAKEVTKCLSGFRDRYLELMHPGNKEMKTTIHDSFQVVNKQATTKLALIERLMGLTGPDVPTTFQLSSNRAKKSKVVQEQKEEEAQNEDEPDVLPQKDQGVDQIIAS